LRGEVGLHGAEVTGTLRMLSDSTAKASLDLRSAKVGVLFDSRDSWPEASKLTLDGFEYGDIDQDSPRSAKERLEWLGRMPNGQFLPQPYEQLAKWFQRTGHDSEAKAIRIAKEEKRLENMSWEREPYQRVFWHLAGLLVDYGYRPQKIVPYLLTLICTCAFIFWVGYPQSMTQSVSYQYAVQQENASLGHANATNYPTFNPIIYSIDVALPIVDLQQERYWMPDSESQFGATYWFVNWIEVLAGWVLTSFAIAGATGIIRKD
ncbi:MAG: hypothetical protein Q8O35_11185, partial [Humidesulfovibrio sp.]|uniref:hypothetical protein n=1 Tax=Humidesulfovibrio sp. TaxID=2910988 RepID=UPI0027332874